MAITYNNLYLDIRQQLHQAGLPAATLEARELVCCAAGKSREELSRVKLIIHLLQILRLLKSRA